jgi:hypothetical protein
MNQSTPGTRGSGPRAFLSAGAIAETSYSPLFWARLIAGREYVSPF